MKNDRERELWVLNDEGLHSWWKSTRMSMRQFIRENRQEIDEAIDHGMSPGRPAPYARRPNPFFWQNPIKPKYDYPTAEGQKRMQRSADQRILDVCKTFNEIMSGPNPLTKDEIRQMIKKRPDLYGCLRAWVKDE